MSTAKNVVICAKFLKAARAGVVVVVVFVFLVAVVVVAPAALPWELTVGVFVCLYGWPTRPSSSLEMGFEKAKFRNEIAKDIDQKFEISRAR